MVTTKTRRDRKIHKRATKEGSYGITVTLPHEQIEYIKRQGNASEEVRKAISDRMASESEEAFQKLVDDEVLADWKIRILEGDIANQNSDWKWVGEKRNAVVGELRAEHDVLKLRLAIIRKNKFAKEREDKKRAEKMTQEVAASEIRKKLEEDIQEDVAASTTS